MVESGDERVVQTIDDARSIARRYAMNANIAEERVLAAAESWFDAGKDDEASRGLDLVNFLERRSGASVE